MESLITALLASEHGGAVAVVLALGIVLVAVIKVRAPPRLSDDDNTESRARIEEQDE